ncbi:hypothetical protein E3U55_14365 [Filobacillus milosensis]|uniref:Competence protein CoiA n=1 Tax=Filobacillus milosensis TaxID=94137 RepID=A0A4Y8IDN8_9BACI|nr:competence protein CoiA family protein [Filobacillus milosensis]TFB14098.1 hypothetical protein E3U55_14365 [Filobacillus milosensis]
MVDLKYPLATDNTHNIVLANEATPRQDYYCIGCGSVMRRRKGKKRAHFFHKSDESNCSSESALHIGFKKLLYNRIDESLTGSKELIIHWNCDICGELHQRNVLNKTKRVEIEKSFGPCRPDISLLDENDKLIIAIEIIVTHEPEESTLNYYIENKVALIRFKLTDVSDFDILQNEVLKPTSVDVCLSPKCNRCGDHAIKSYLYIIQGECWRCESKMNISSIVDNFERIYTPDEYSKEQIAL